MSSNISPSPSSPRLSRFAALGALVGVAAVVAWQNAEEVRRGVQATMDMLRGAGPGWYFGAMAILPSFGFPMLPFALTAGPVFGAQLGLPMVMACAIAAIAVNVALSYLLAAHALRPWAGALLARWGQGDALVRGDFGWRWILFVRLAPGLPFFVQSYLLGLTRAPLAPYIVISTAVPGISIAAAIWLGDSLWRAHAREALWSMGALIAVVLAAQWMRRRRAAAQPGNALRRSDPTG